MDRINKKNIVIQLYALTIIDIISAMVSFLIALLIRFKALHGVTTQDMYTRYSVMLVAIIVLYSLLTDWNRDFFIRGFFKEFMTVIKYVAIITIVSVALLFVTKDISDLSRIVFGSFAGINVILTYLLHISFKEYMYRCYRTSINSDKLIVVAESDKIESIVNRILGEKNWNYELTGLAVIDKDMVGKSIGGVPVIANKDNLIDVATQNVLDRVFISLPHADILMVKDMIMDFESMGVLCHYNVDIDELDLEGKEAGTFAGYSVISYSLQNMDYRRLMIKRAIDILGSLVGLLITGILFPFVALAIKIESRGPVVFRQERIGKNGRRFYIYKFRSMYQDAEARLKDLMDKNEVQGLMFKLEDDPRITKVGKFIRKTSIDELPQFMNVFKGDMSLVGTRPPTVNEFEQYNAHYRRRLCITPGLTGMWQVSGRSDIKDFDEVVKLDLEYIDKWSLGLDIKILIKTVFVVLCHRGSK